MKRSKARQTVRDYSDIMSFGKWKGKSFKTIADTDPSYLVWLNNEEIVDMPKEMVEAALSDWQDDPKHEYGDSWGWDGWLDD